MHVEKIEKLENTTMERHMTANASLNRCCCCCLCGRTSAKAELPHGPLTTAVLEARKALGQLCDILDIARTLEAPLELLAAAQRALQLPDL